MLPISVSSIHEREAFISSLRSVNSQQIHVLLFPLFLLSCYLTGECNLMLIGTLIRLLYL